ncbi:FBP domain-containing protein [soil metagenome]
MTPLTAETIRNSFANASRRESGELTILDDLDQLRWDRLDYLGWRDAKFPRRAYVVVPVDGVPIGIVLKQADADPRTRAQCSWCQDVTLPNQVVIYGAKRAGAAGRNGNTIATLLCAEFECSVNVRKAPPVAYLGFDVEAARDERIAGLQLRAARFAASVLDGD